MTDNLNTPKTEFKPVPSADMAEAHKVMDDFEKLTDEQFEVLLAGGSPIGYLTDADETADEPTPTVH